MSTDPTPDPSPPTLWLNRLTGDTGRGRNAPEGDGWVLLVPVDEATTVAVSDEAPADELALVPDAGVIREAASSLAAASRSIVSEALLAPTAGNVDAAVHLASIVQHLRDTAALVAIGWPAEESVSLQEFRERYAAPDPLAALRAMPEWGCIDIIRSRSRSGAYLDPAWIADVLDALVAAAGDRPEQTEGGA